MICRRYGGRIIAPASSGAAPAFVPFVGASAPTLFDLGGRVGGATTAFNNTTGAVVFELEAIAGAAIGYAVNAPRYSIPLTDPLPLFDTSKHGLLVRITNVTLPALGERNGLAFFVTDHIDTGGTGGGGGVIQDQTTLGQYGGESDGSTSFSAAVDGLFAEEVLYDFRFLEGGDLQTSVSSRSTLGSGAWEKVVSNRRAQGWGSRQLASALFGQVACSKASSGAPTDGEVCSGTYEVAMYEVPAGL